MIVLCNLCAVSQCGQLKPEMQLLLTATSHVPSIELEQYVGLHCCHILSCIAFISSNATSTAWWCMICASSIWRIRWQKFRLFKKT